MKTFGLYLLLFVLTTICIATSLKYWTTQEVIIEGTLLSYVMYRLIKETLDEN